MTLTAAAADALDSFRSCPGWEQRARLLLAWGARLEPLDDEQRSEANRVRGCESNVWLIAEQHAGTWQFKANSDARLISGLLALLLARVNGMSAAELARVDLPGWFNQLGLGRQLSPSRSNGLNAVLQRMRELSAGS
ncbi:SufE family protein [Pseudomonas sp. N040]|uniref:SufE family protein n=1 Tax=Pseudomonas sp. N040 TaxID=2785325 RepID=UPI0018A3186D|nr:SufE family protein [Pseudomonas sp. N040]MBF7729692.1 SufE family protein [Pseudomonas sp. N040]MBW7013334.1 SufE family protein [Pseudomonas sp. N040]